jgi:hypothetical protein
MPKFEDAEWDEWTDRLGQTYTVGDIVSVATISGKSPQLVVAEVLRINRKNSRGEEIGEWYYDGQVRTRRPSCTVSALPLLDARGFGRYSDFKYNKATGHYEHTGNLKAVNYSIPANILKLAFTKEDLFERLADETRGVHL